MTQVINTGDSGSGVALGILVAILIAAFVYFFVIREGGNTIDTPNVDVNVSAPSVPGTSSN